MLQPRTIAWVLALGALALACAKAPYTGRRQYNLVPDGIMRGLGKSSYTGMLAEVKVKKTGDAVSVLNKVGNRISRVANEPKYDWQFTLIDDDQVNAWCLPGGYIGFYTGILPALDNEAGMAFVMGHEVGHAIAKHGAERMSQQLTLVGGLLGLEAYMANKTKLEPSQRAVVLGALGIAGYGAILLPFSRMHESEADVIGMMYMASAGYPPGESIAVWDRMHALSGGGSLPPFLSTHPPHDKRQAKLKEWMPQARKKYQRNKLAYDTQKTLWSADSTGGSKQTVGGSDDSEDGRRGSGRTKGGGDRQR